MPVYIGNDFTATSKGISVKDLIEQWFEVNDVPEERRTSIPLMIIRCEEEEGGRPVMYISINVLENQKIPTC